MNLFRHTTPPPSDGIVDVTDLVTLDFFDGPTDAELERAARARESEPASLPEEGVQPASKGRAPEPQAAPQQPPVARTGATQTLAVGEGVGDLRGVGDRDRRHRPGFGALHVPVPLAVALLGLGLIGATLTVALGEALRGPAVAGDVKGAERPHAHASSLGGLDLKNSAFPLMVRAIKHGEKAQAQILERRRAAERRAKRRQQQRARRARDTAAATRNAAAAAPRPARHLAPHAAVTSAYAPSTAAPRANKSSPKPSASPAAREFSPR